MRLALQNALPKSTRTHGVFTRARPRPAIGSNGHSWVARPRRAALDFPACGPNCHPPRRAPAPTSAESQPFLHRHGALWRNASPAWHHCARPETSVRQRPIHRPHRHCAPVRGGEWLGSDVARAARLQVAEELGHAREKITAAYFGSSAVMRRKVARRPPAVGADDPDSTYSLVRRHASTEACSLTASAASQAMSCSVATTEW